MNFNQRFVLFLLLPALLFAQQTIQICALRVEFIADDNPLTTGPGLMIDDSVTTEPLAIDPAPHNRTYFYDQIRAADNYYNTVSGGRVRIDGAVFPREADQVYQLPEKMAFYNPNTTEQEINTGLARLFADALGLADADPDINFADYDLVVVFHAGVGRDIEFDFDETTQDISSLFLTGNFLKGVYGSAFNGFLVDQESYLINQGIILPEMLNQEGLQIALTGLFVANIASYLGALDLFNPLTGRSVAGRFSLMDAGLLNANGLIPAPPDAFTRERLGWDDPTLIKSDSSGIGLENYFSGAGTAHSKLVKIPINENEYYLLEHRGLPGFNLDSLYAAAITDELPGYLSVLAAHVPEKIHISDSSGVLLAVENYDLGLPGSGVLIWHIDRGVITAGEEQNRVNDDDSRRGVDLEEADGSQDLGKYYTLLDAGYQTDLGYFADFWYESNPAYLYRNEFGPQTRPSTGANVSRAWSGITIKNFSAKNNPVIFFEFEREGLEQGFPIQVTMPEPGLQNLNYFTSAQGDGWLMINDHGSRLVLTEAGVPEPRQISWPAQLFTSDSISDVLSDPDHPGLLYVVLGQSVTALQADGSGLQISELFELNRTIRPGSRAAAAHNRLALITTDGNLEVWSDSGVLLSSTPVAAEARSVLFDPEGNILTSGMELANLTAFQADGRLLTAGYHSGASEIHILEASQTVGTIRTDDLFSGEFAVGDVDGNGLPDLIFASGNQVFACHLNGRLLTGFPKSFYLQEGDRFSRAPLLRDENQDGRVEIFTASDMGVLFRIGDPDSPLFPLTISAPIASTPALFYNPDRELMFLVLLSREGNLYSWKIGSGSPQTGDWLMSHINSGHNRYRSVASNPVALSGGIMPVKSVFNYPNPNQSDFTTIRYYLNEDARVKIRIYDLAGDLADEFDGPGLAHQANEKVWNVSHISSGIYLAHIQAKTTSKTVSAVIKIMVVH